MRIARPWWHKLLRPYFNWRADVRDKREAEARLTAEHLVGYFQWQTPMCVCVVRALESGAGKRRIEWLQGAQFADLCGQAAVKAWLAGDDVSARGALHTDLTSIPGLLNLAAARKKAR